MSWWSTDLTFKCTDDVSKHCDAVITDARWCCSWRHQMCKGVVSKIDTSPGKVSFFTQYHLKQGLIKGGGVLTPLPPPKETQWTIWAYSQLLTGSSHWNSGWAHFEDTHLPHSKLTRWLTLWACYELSMSWQLTLWACCELFVRLSWWAHHAVLHCYTLKRSVIFTWK